MLTDTRKKADINISSSGDTTSISAGGDGTYLAIDHIDLVPASAVTVQLKTGSTAYGGAYQLAANQHFVLQNVYGGQEGIITCGNNEAFVINLGSAVQVSGIIRYRVVGS